ncbi:MAG: formylglycine-generating enzyme family protein [Candidatus Binatia bacterium]
MPIRVVLREFVARGLMSLAPQQEVNGDTLWNFLVTELPETLRDFSVSLRAELLLDGGLLLLDGLDEVPEADARRVQVKTAVEQFTAVFPKVRILVTSRTYAYQKQDWKLNGFAEAVLAPFEQGQIHTFVERWYAFVGSVRKLTKEDAQGRAVVLNAAIDRNPRLFELATRPLLLTLIASLHAWRGGTLPEQREELYADAVELLLDQWESQKFKRLPDGTYAVAEPSLVEWLRVDHKKMRQLLNRLAFEAHRDQPLLVGTADIAQTPVVEGLLQLNPQLDANPGQLIAYLRDRAGILEPRGVGIYAFPHRTFQEYLAACYCTDQADFPDNIAERLRAEPNRWREVTLLAGAKIARGGAGVVWNVAEALCFADPPETKPADEKGYWGALLAAQILIENNSLQQIAERNKSKVERIRRWLACILTHGALPLVDRVQAGDALAVIGDPRFHGPDVYRLPNEPLLGFVEIPAGPFVMGSDPHKDKGASKDEQPQHEVTLPRYYIARYPVTVAQFAAFVEASGYEPRRGDRWRGVLNHPLVNVTWHDARAYCQWLTEQLRTGNGFSAELSEKIQNEGWEVTLPSEAEWEKAARGPSTGLGEGRVYPWGNDLEEDRANLDEAGLGRPSAVGSFPQGASPYGCLDMAGNVWEWTRSVYAPYPYPNDYEGRIKREPMNTVVMEAYALRGGSFFLTQGSARCAVRLRFNSNFTLFFGYGFRVVVLPKKL